MHDMDAATDAAPPANTPDTHATTVTPVASAAQRSKVREQNGQAPDPEYMAYGDEGFDISPGLPPLPPPAPPPPLPPLAAAGGNKKEDSRDVSRGTSDVSRETSQVSALALQDDGLCAEGEAAALCFWQPAYQETKEGDTLVCSNVKRDLVYRQKRPINTGSRLTRRPRREILWYAQVLKRDLVCRQNRPTDTDIPQTQETQEGSKLQQLLPAPCLPPLPGGAEDGGWGGLLVWIRVCVCVQ